MKRLFLIAALGTVSVLSAGLLTGCGGGSGSVASGGTGRATFTIDWPAPSTRLIPIASNSVKIDISNGTQVVASQVVPKPAAGGQATATFDTLPVGTLSATASARPQADGTGTPQAQATVPILINAGQNTTVHLTMASTIDHLEVVPTVPRVQAGQSRQLAVNAKDAAGNVVLVSTSNLQWSSANAAVGTVDTNGNFTGVASGTTQVTVTESESGKGGAATVRVPPPGGLFNSAWPKFRGNLLDTGVGSGGGAAGSVAWSPDLGSGTNSSPVIGPNHTIFIGTFAGDARAFDSTGTQKWAFTTGGPVNASPTVGADGTVYIGSEDSTMYALDPSTGAKKWSAKLGAAIQSTATITSDAKIIVGADDGKIYALDALDGATLWTATTGGAVKSSAAIALDGTLYIGSSDGKVYALNPADGSAKWSRQTGDAIASSPTVGPDGTVYVPSFDRNLYALNPADGSVKWAFLTTRNIVSAPALAADGTLYFGTLDGKLYAVNAADGTERHPAVTTGGFIQSSPAIAANGTVYVGSSDRNLYAFNPDLTVRWSVLTGGALNSSPAIDSDGTVYIGSLGPTNGQTPNTGNLYAIK